MDTMCGVDLWVFFLSSSRIFGSFFFSLLSLLFPATKEAKSKNLASFIGFPRTPNPYFRLVWVVSSDQPSLPLRWSMKSGDFGRFNELLLGKAFLITPYLLNKILNFINSSFCRLLALKKKLFIRKPWPPLYNVTLMLGSRGGSSLARQML